MEGVDTKGGNTKMRSQTWVREQETTTMLRVRRNHHNIDRDTKPMTTGNNSITNRGITRAMVVITKEVAEAVIDSNNSSTLLSITNSSRQIRDTDMALVNNKITTISSNSHFTHLSQIIISVNMHKEAKIILLSSSRCRLKTSRVYRAPILQQY
jgi:hypothetical protein